MSDLDVYTVQAISAQAWVKVSSLAAKIGTAKTEIIEAEIVLEAQAEKRAARASAAEERRAAARAAQEATAARERQAAAGEKLQRLKNALQAAEVALAEASSYPGGHPLPPTSNIYSQVCASDV